MINAKYKYKQFMIMPMGEWKFLIYILLFFLHKMTAVTIVIKFNGHHYFFFFLFSANKMVNDITRQNDKNDKITSHDTHNSIHCPLRWMCVFIEFPWNYFWFVCGELKRSILFEVVVQLCNSFRDCAIIQIARISNVQCWAYGLYRTSNRTCDTVLTTQHYKELLKEIFRRNSASN